MPPPAAAQHAGSGAKQAAPAGQQPVHAAPAFGSKAAHDMEQQEPWRMLHCVASAHGVASAHAMRQAWGGESGHMSGAAAALPPTAAQSAWAMPSGRAHGCTQPEPSPDWSSPRAAQWM